MHSSFVIIFVIEIPAPDFDLEKTLNSGQVFHWEKIDNGFVGTIGNYAVYVEQGGDTLRALTEGGAPATPGSRRAAAPGSQELAPPIVESVARYFALDHPLAEICASFPQDPVMNTARDFCRGLRIIRQPKWECLATFICSSMKQVAHIRQISAALRNSFGDQGKIGSHLIYTFSDANLREKLCALPGVGAKVANCVMLFAYERLRAFPIDVWIERILRQQYFPRRKKVTGLRLREFSETYFGEHGGYAQQYLFHHARTALRKPGLSRDSSTPKAFGARNDKRRNQRRGDSKRRSRNRKALAGQVVSPAGLG